MALTKDQITTHFKRHEELREINAILVTAVRSLFIRASEITPGTRNGWQFYIHPFLREKLHTALIDEARKIENDYHELARKAVLNEFMGIPITDGYEYGIVLAHEQCLFYPEERYVLKDLFVTHDTKAPK